MLCLCEQSLAALTQGRAGQNMEKAVSGNAETAF
jgi:hypothetical protein